MRRFGRHAFWFALYAAFTGAAFVLRAHLQSTGADEIWGWDYRTFVGQIRDWRWIGYFGFRHPGLGIVCSPLVALEHVWSGAYLLVMPIVATVTARLIWSLSGWGGLVVWLTFPATWLLAGVPESFPFAQLALLASVWWMCRRGGSAAPGGSGVAAAVFSALNLAITLTNGIKPLLGWLALSWRRLDRRTLVRGGWIALGLALSGVCFFSVRSLVTGRGVAAGVAATVGWIPAVRHLPRELYGFFIRPVGLWQSFVVYPLALSGICRMIRTGRTPFLALLAPYFIVDVVIHLVVGWGMSEPWVFAPHWIWLLPLVTGEEIRRVLSLFARNGK